MSKYRRQSQDRVVRAIASSIIALGLVEGGVSIRDGAGQTFETEVSLQVGKAGDFRSETLRDRATESHLSFAVSQPLTAASEDFTLDAAQLHEAVTALSSPSEIEAEIVDVDAPQWLIPSSLQSDRPLESSPTDGAISVPERFANAQQIPVLPPPEPEQPAPPPQTFAPDAPPPPGYSPPPFEFDYYNQFNRYRLGIGDSISIAVQGFPEFNFQGAIDLEGNVVIPILGAVSLIGLTLEEVNAKISYELGQRYLQREPEVTTLLANPRLATVTIVGEVFQPGFYNLVPGAEVDEAIVQAGGSTRQADLRSVIVRRSLVDGTTIEREVNLFASLQNGMNLPPLRLQDGDAVVVPKLTVGTDQDYDRILVSRSTVAQPQITVRVLSYPNQALGAITLANGSTFLDAITQLNLNLQESDLSEIGLLRFDPEQGKVVAQRLDGLDAIRGDVSQDVPLLDEDVIVVDRSTLSAIDYVLGIVTRPITSVLQLVNFVRDTVLFSIPDVFRPNRVP